ncbi:pseudouridine synthase [Thalassotalea litorea]|uniref:pseudouridine synthase n=1 Tax=Thalassotalea litorea TaxID=2020715 RepID=UPI001FEC9E7B|nr:pseudouridine synthase [Thalassotalea litorea]
MSKPSGINFHDEDSIGQGFFNRYKRLYGELYPVHRLDKITSGILLMAKTPESARHLSELFANQKIGKVYIALASGKPKKKQGCVKGDMVKSRRGTYKLLRTQENPAITQFDSYSLSPGLRLYKLMPKTGKTHQLRVAMNSLGTAILGDPNYHAGDSGNFPTDRGYLHAVQISFNFRDEQFQFTDTIPTHDGKLFATYQDDIKQLLKL